MPDATILQFPRAKIRPDVAAIMWAIDNAGDDRLLNLACLTMGVVDDARRQQDDGNPQGIINAMATAYICLGMLLGTIDREANSA